MPAPYLTTEEAQARLVTYDVVAQDERPSERELLAASDILDLKRGFTGLPYDEDQLRAFPRTPALSDDEENVVPEAILDWVALTAFQLSEEHEPAVRSERIEDLSVSFQTPKRARVERIKKHLLLPYRGAGVFRIV